MKEGDISCRLMRGRTLGDVGEFAPSREASGEVFAVEGCAQQVPFQREVLADRSKHERKV